MDELDGQHVSCPLCEGRGEFRRSELLARLTEPGFLQTVSGWVKGLAGKDEETTEEEHANVAATSSGHATEVHAWPSKRILWRRSPKE